MQRYEYKVVPAPERGQKARGVKTPEARFAHALTEALNALAAEGWEYHRAETLPCAESKGFFSSGKDTVYRSMLVFRRPLPVADETAAEHPAAPPVSGTPDRPRSRVLMAIPSDRAEAPAGAETEEVAAAGTGPVLRAERGAPDAGPANGPAFRWPLRAETGEPKPPRPVLRGDQG